MQPFENWITERREALELRAEELRESLAKTQLETDLLDGLLSCKAHDAPVISAPITLQNNIIEDDIFEYMAHFIKPIGKKHDLYLIWRKQYVDKVSELDDLIKLYAENKDPLYKSLIKECRKATDRLNCELIDILVLIYGGIYTPYSLITTAVFLHVKANETQNKPIITADFTSGGGVAFALRCFPNVY